MGAVDQAQAFTTGAKALGYTLTAVEAEFARVMEAIDINDFVGTWSSDEEVAPSDDSDTHHEPQTKLDKLSCPVLVINNNDRVYTRTTTGIDLEANTTYLFVVDTNVGYVNNLRNTSSDSEDSRGTTGWSIANDSIYRNNSETGSWSTWGDSKKIRISCTVKNTTPPAANSEVSTKEDTAYSSRPRTSVSRTRMRATCWKR
ncbi:hypothetical protein FLM9_73 [Candidatus Synechococcus spongiarum]|uniref:Uncharacterized protein n=1 Tax=Candidatus Synechococcus spongiarum TaxID=431041 RepID=A0A161KA25_9SYNE|nr:hypothetical protein FLM9_73 [Candidatus Synechococcus spongiarum]